MKYDKINKILFYNTYKMPEIFDWYINNILNNNSKFLKENLTDFIIKTNLTKMSSEEAQQIEESLLLLWIQDIDTTLIETLFARWYLEKIVWNEERIKSLVQIWFGLDFTSILSLCNNSKEEINQSISKFQRLFQKLSELKELWFCFDGKSFCNILHISENQIERIIGHKEQFLFLYQFWVHFNLADWEYFYFHESLVNTLFSLWEKLKLSGKIWLQISLKHICAIKNKVDLRKELENTQEAILWKIQAILWKIQAILWMKNKNLDDEVKSSQKIITTDKILNNNFIIQEEKPIKEFIYSFNEDSNNINPSFLDTIDEVVFDTALKNIEILWAILSYLWIETIDIKDFLELSYLFEKPICLVSALSSWLRIDLNTLKRYKAELLQFENPDFTKRVKLLTSIWVDVSLHNANAIENITEEQFNQIKQNKTHIMALTDYEEPKEWIQVARIRKWMRITGTEVQIEIMCSENLEEFVEIYKSISKEKKWNQIFNPANLSFIMNITSQNPWDLTRFINTYFEYNFPVWIIDALLKEQMIDNLEDFLKKFSENWLKWSSLYLNEFIILCEAFWYKVNENVKKQTYNYNIKTLLSWWPKPSNITSLDEIFNKLEVTWFLQWKITKDNIEEIWAIVNTWTPEEKYDKFILGNDIDTYKKIVRALWEYMYIWNLNENFNLYWLCQIFWKLFNSTFLIDFSKSYKSHDLTTYLLSKKVRLQDIERAYNNYDKLFSLDIKNPYYKFCLDYAVETDNYDYLAQNIETIKYLNNNGFFHKIISWISTPNIQDIEVWEIKNTIVKYFLDIKSIHWKEKITPEILIKLINNILNFTWWYLTVSMIEWYIRWKSLQELLEESLEAKKEVLSPNTITHFNLATYEIIFLAYRPTGKYTIDTIKQNIENGNIQDCSHHLKWIHYNPDGYPMEFFQRSYILEWKQDSVIVKWIHDLLNWKPSKQNIFTSMNLKLFFSQATSLFSTSDWTTIWNDGILELITHIYALNKDSRIQSYLWNFSWSEFNYDRLSSLREIFSAVTKDSFWLIIAIEIDSLPYEEKVKLWESIGKLKDKNIKAKYDELNKKYETSKNSTERLIEIFMWRLLEYAKTIRKYITAEMKKFKEIKWKQTPVKAILSKNIWSFFAKAGAWLCTWYDYKIWSEERHIHLNLIDEKRQEIIWNVMLYFEPGRNYLIARWFNPRDDIETSYDVNHMVDEMIRVVKEIAVQNWYVDDYWEALVYVPPNNDDYINLTNRVQVWKRFKYFIEQKDQRVYNANFEARSIWTWLIYHTLHRI